MLEQDLEKFSLVLMGIIILIIMYAYIGTLFQYKQIHFIHETGVGIIIGIIFGAIMYFVNGLEDYQFNQQIFFYALLPPMIFSGGYNLKKRRFFQNFYYISLFGALGTITAFGIIFGLTYLINQLGWIRQWSDIDKKITLSLSLIIKYSATICASDSVAALTMIKPNKYPKLFSIIFGEGMVNDAVAIILFKVVGDIFDNGVPDQNAASIILGILWKFIVNVLCSLVIGGLCALICSKLFKVSRFLTHNPVIQVTTLYLFGILSYVIAQVLEMSGVITVLVCGICLAHFNFYNLSITGQISTGVTFQTVSFIAQAFVFIYLGLSTIFYVKKQTFSYTFILLQLLICSIARFTAVFGLSFIFKFCKKKWQVSIYQLLIVTVAGVIRGSVAFALILTLQGGQQVSIVKSSVLLMVFITTIFLGAIMPGFITSCLNKDKKNQKEQKQIQVPILQLKKQKQLKGFKKFDEIFLKPFFIYDYANRKKQIKQFKRLLKLNSPDYKGGQFMGLLVANTRQTLRGTFLQSQNKISIVSQ